MKKEEKDKINKENELFYSKFEPHEHYLLNKRNEQFFFVAGLRQAYRLAEKKFGADDTYFLAVLKGQLDNGENDLEDLQVLVEAEGINKKLNEVFPSI